MRPFKRPTLSTTAAHSANCIGSPALDAFFSRYLHNFSKEKAGHQIEFEPPGSFYVRRSESHPGCFALAYMSGGVLSYQLVEETVSGLRIRQSASNFFST